MLEPTTPIVQGEVQKLRPAQMRDRTLAAYLDCSPATIRRWRAEDSKAIREGREPSGPPWHKFDNSIFYFTDEIDEWRKSKGERYGTVVYPNKKPKAAKGKA